jgi:hypothetical protein
MRSTNVPRLHDIRRISVAIRELGDGGVWRIAEAGADPVPVSVLMLDIRRGRSAELRMEVAKALCAHCIDILGLREDRLNVEFTQHTGDEMYHPALGGYSPEWEAGGCQTVCRYCAARRYGTPSLMKRSSLRSCARRRAGMTRYLHGAADAFPDQRQVLRF